MPKFKVVNPDAPEEIDFYQDIPLVDPDTGTDQLDSDGNILVKRYVNHTVSLKGINEVKDALPAIKTNTQNLEELYQYAHTQSEAHQTAINNNASAIVDLQTSASEMALDLETLTNKINGIQGIDIDELKDYVYTQVPLIKNSYLPLVGGTITGNLTIEEGTITGSLTGVASNATADVNNKKLTSYVADIMGANAQLSIIKGDGTTSVLSINNVLNATNASTSSKLQNARVLTINDTLDNLGAGVSFDGSKNITISLPPYIATQLLKDKTKCYGNDYYDDSNITSLIYAGNGAGTLRNEIANGNFARVHPGQTIIGRVTGTTYVVVGCNIYLHRGESKLMLTRNHIGLMPIQLIGNAGNLLWSGRISGGSDVNNTQQGCAPWASDNETEGKNQTSCYKDSYIANTVLPKVDNLWLKPDFENQGISVLTFRNLEALSFDANATCMSNPNWCGCATGFRWASRRLVLPSEPEIYGHYSWAGSSFESGSQHTQLPLYRHKEIHKVSPRADIWLKNSASASYACLVNSIGIADAYVASYAARVCPLFLIA